MFQHFLCNIFSICLLYNDEKYDHSSQVNEKLVLKYYHKKEC